MTSTETENQEMIQLLNTAIIKSKEKNISSSYETRLSKACKSPAILAISKAVTILAEEQKLSRDEAAVQIIENIRELDSIWGDYVMMEGLGKLKELLKNNKPLH